MYENSRKLRTITIDDDLNELLKIRVQSREVSNLINRLLRAHFHRSEGKRSPSDITIELKKKTAELKRIDAQRSALESELQIANDKKSKETKEVVVWQKEE